MNYFSIIIPAFNAEKTIQRTIASIINQSYPNWQIVVVDDGSTDRTREKIKEMMARDRRIRMFCHRTNFGKLIARNTGFKEVQGEWICMLDADDEYMSNYLEEVNNAIERYPDYKLFNFGMIIKDREVVNGKRYEKGWRIIEPLHLEETAKGHISFPKGKIGMGSFVFHISLLDEFGFYPDTRVAYGLEDSLPALLVKKDPIYKEICQQNEEGHWLPLGNPYGDDYILFWKLTRTNKSKTLDNILYIQHIKI